MSDSTVQCRRICSIASATPISAFQNDGPGGVCKGFFVCRPSPTVRDFFIRVLERMRWRGENDQEATNALLRTRPNSLLITLLPECYWTHGRSGKIWNPGDPLSPPSHLLMHHANWTHGMTNKLALLDAVMTIHEHRTAAPPENISQSVVTSGLPRPTKNCAT